MKKISFLLTNRLLFLLVIFAILYIGICVRVNAMDAHPKSIVRAEHQKTALTITHANANAKSTVTHSSNSQFVKLFKQKNVFWLLLIFLGIGLLLTFTPCVLPMIPILSSIIIGQGKCTPLKSFKLSLTYVLGMAFTYAIAGVAAGYLGSTIQGFLQQPWVIVSMSLVFVLLALSMFGLFELRMPNWLSHRIHSLSNQQRGGTYLGTAMMGILATLIVSPCVSAPLVGVLAYIGQTGNAFLGGLALFTMAVGMGIPLIIIGTTHGALLPKAGGWLHHVKVIAGIMLIAVAIWMISRILPEGMTLFLWGSFAIMIAIFFGALSFRKQDKIFGKLQQGIAMIVLIYGGALLIGALGGHVNLLQPLASDNAIAKNGALTHPVNLGFQEITTLNSLTLALKEAKRQQKPVMLDFSADWCPDCKWMKQHTFTDPKVQRLLGSFVMLHVDMTKTPENISTIMKAYQVIGPPVLVFYDANGKERNDLKAVGLTKPKVLIERLQQLH